MNGIKIRSDFNDYYDIYSSQDPLLYYDRYLKNCKQRGSALKYLRYLGIKTIEVKQVNQFFSGDGEIVVYTDPKGHNGNGKYIMTVNNAMQYYGNCLASHYYSEAGDLTLKFLQIGKRRFSLYYKKDNVKSLELGNLIYYKEAEPDYNRLVGLPIYSIDYISNGVEMIATDFNEVENLQSIGLSGLMNGKEVNEEIFNALLVYNKGDK